MICSRYSCGYGSLLLGVEGSFFTRFEAARKTLNFNFDFHFNDRFEEELLNCSCWTIPRVARLAPRSA